MRACGHVGTRGGVLAGARRAPVVSGLQQQLFPATQHNTVDAQIRLLMNAVSMAHDPCRDQAARRGPVLRVAREAVRRAPHARGARTCARRPDMRAQALGHGGDHRNSDGRETRAPIGYVDTWPGERRLGTWTLGPVPRSEKLHRRSKSGGGRVSGGGVGRRRLSHGRCLESWCVAWCVVRAACAVRDAAAAHPARITIALHTHVACHIAHTMLLCMRKCLCHTSCIVHTALCQV